MSVRDYFSTSEKRLQQIAGRDGADMMADLLEERGSSSFRPGMDEEAGGDRTGSELHGTNEGESWSVHTRRLLERVGKLQSALSCPLTLEDLCDTESTTLGKGFVASREGLSVSDGLLPSGEEAPRSRGPAYDDGGPLRRQVKTHLAEVPNKKRKYAAQSGKDARRDESLKQHCSLSPAACSLLLESLPKVTGVFFDRSQERWVSSVYMGGRNIKSYFPVYKHGFLEARNMAITQRLSQVAHKGLAQTDVDARTPPDVTVSALLDALKARGLESTSASLVPGNKRQNVQVATKANMQQQAKEPHQQDHLLPPATTLLRELAKLAARTAKGSPGASLSSESTASPASRFSESPRVGAASAAGGGACSVSVSPPASMGISRGLALGGCGDSLLCGVEALPTSLVSALHMHAALDLCPWEGGISWGPDALAWAVQQPSETRGGGGVIHVPVRLGEAHVETLQALGSWMATVGDRRKRAKVVLELRRIGRLRSSKLQQEELTEEKSGSVNIPPVKNEDEEEEAPEGSKTQKKQQQHQQQENESLNATLPLLGGGTDDGKNRHEEQQAETVKRGTRRDTRQGSESLAPGSEDTLLSPEIVAAAGAVFHAVRQAYEEALSLLRRSDDAASDEEMLANLEDNPAAVNSPQGAPSLSEESGNGDSPWSPPRSGPRNNNESLGATHSRSGPHAVGSTKSSGAAKRALMTRAALSLKPWPQGVSWASSSGRWFAVARLPSGSRVARTFHPSTKGGVAEAYRLACGFIKKIKDDPIAAQADLTASTKQSGTPGRRPLDHLTPHEQELFAAPQELQHRSSSSSSSSNSSSSSSNSSSSNSNSSSSIWAYSRNNASPQSLTQWWQRQRQASNLLSNAGVVLPADLEGLAAMEACCGVERTPEASSGNSPSNSRRLLLESLLRKGTAAELLSLTAEEQQQQQQQQGDGKGAAEKKERGQLNDLHFFEGEDRTTLAHTVPREHYEEETQADSDQSRVLALQQEAVRRCLLDLRELSASLFTPHVREQKAATVNAHLDFVSNSRSFHSVVVYLQLFESALFGGHLPSRMPVDTQRVFFGALDALAGALKLQSRDGFTPKDPSSATFHTSFLPRVDTKCQQQWSTA